MRLRKLTSPPPLSDSGFWLDKTDQSEAGMMENILFVVDGHFFVIMVVYLLSRVELFML